jgi:hypothetical protein
LSRRRRGRRLGRCGQGFDDGLKPDSEEAVTYPDQANRNAQWRKLSRCGLEKLELDREPQNRGPEKANGAEQQCYRLFDTQGLEECIDWIHCSSPERDRIAGRLNGQPRGRADSKRLAVDPCIGIKWLDRNTFTTTASMGPGRDRSKLFAVWRASSTVALASRGPFRVTCEPIQLNGLRRLMTAHVTSDPDDDIGPDLGHPRKRCFGAPDPAGFSRQSTGQPETVAIRLSITAGGVRNRIGYDRIASSGVVSDHGRLLA